MHDHRWLAAIILAIALLAGASEVLGLAEPHSKTPQILFWVGLVCAILLYLISKPRLRP